MKKEKCLPIMELAKKSKCNYYTLKNAIIYLIAEKKVLTRTTYNSKSGKDRILVYVNRRKK